MSAVPHPDLVDYVEEQARLARVNGAPFVLLFISQVEALLERARAGAVHVRPPGRPWSISEIAEAFPLSSGKLRSRTSATLMVTSGFFGAPHTAGGPFKQGKAWRVPDALVQARLQDRGADPEQVEMPCEKQAIPAKRTGSLTALSDVLGGPPIPSSRRQRQRERGAA